MLIGEDKFLVVAMVMAIIFIGIAVYLFFLDKKLGKIEKRQQELINDKRDIK
ncbi:MAG TPA: CcmD family protein [Lentimicrobium sp.]|nr:CcmD family protein [Lentimicrobium sp.]